MKFQDSVEQKYRDAVNSAIEAIIATGNESHRTVAAAIRDSEMELRVEPVSEVQASGRCGLKSWWSTNGRISDDGSISVEEALAEVYMLFAEETLMAGPRGVEGTFVHEGQHAYDFARLISSFSEANQSPLSIFDPTLYELEHAAHVAAGEYMLLVNKDEYVNEGIDLMILNRGEDGACALWPEGIVCRLKDCYGLTAEAQGQLTSEILRLKPQ